MGLQVAIPDTSLIDCSDLRQKTAKVGLLARAMAVFRVERVIIYETGKLRSKAKRDSDLLVRLFQFMDTPQYLRKRIFPMTPPLKFAGLLPPLRTRSHPLDSEPSELSVGMIRWGVQVRLGKIDIGVGQLVDHSEALSERMPTLLRITVDPVAGSCCAEQIHEVEDGGLHALTSPLAAMGRSADWAPVHPE